MYYRSGHRRAPCAPQSWLLNRAFRQRIYRFLRHAVSECLDQQKSDRSIPRKSEKAETSPLNPVLLPRRNAHIACRTDTTAPRNCQVARCLRDVGAFAHRTLRWRYEHELAGGLELGSARNVTERCRAHLYRTPTR